MVTAGGGNFEPPNAGLTSWNRTLQREGLNFSSRCESNNGFSVSCFLSAAVRYELLRSQGSSNEAGQSGLQMQEQRDGDCAPAVGEAAASAGCGSAQREV